MTDALKNHWPEYLIEGALLGLFMLSACTFAIVIFHPASLVPELVESRATRRVVMGAAMGLTAVAIIYSPWGKRSGAHINPSTTLMFFRLGKVMGWDALFYSAAQFVGGISGVLVASVLFGSFVSDPTVNYVVTKPGRFGVGAAFMGELFISFLLMTIVLTVSNTRKLWRFTGLFVGALVATYISIEDPISGMSMNPARTFSSAFAAQHWDSLWVYFTAPPLGMLLAAEIYLRTYGMRRVLCAKHHHDNSERCIFNCEFGRQQPERAERDVRTAGGSGRSELEIQAGRAATAIEKQVLDLVNHRWRQPVAPPQLF